MQGRIGAAETAAGSRVPSFGDDDDLAVLDVAHEARADDVERAGLRSENIFAVELADNERADAERVARADQLLVGQANQRVSAFDLAQRLDEAVDDAALRLRATRCRMTSVSEVDWKIAPSATNCARSGAHW